MNTEVLPQHYQEYLKLLGLTDEQSRIYEYLLKNGVANASKIALNTEIERTLVYKILDKLVEMGIVIKQDNRKVVRFEAGHPTHLLEIIEARENQVKNAKAALQSALDPMITDYNLTSAKPNIRIFDGLNGIERVLNDSLNSRTEILTYIDIESAVKYFDKVNQEYVKQRERKGIKKRGLVLDSPFARTYLADYHTNVTDTRFLKNKTSAFQNSMQIYSSKISYITLSPESMFGVIIENKQIYDMHRFLFEQQWDIAEAMPSGGNNQVDAITK